MKEWMIPVFIILLFAFAMGDGLYNDRQFRLRCEVAEGVTAGYNTVCVKRGGIIFKSN